MRKLTAEDRTLIHKEIQDFLKDNPIPFTMNVKDSTQDKKFIQKEIAKFIINSWREYGKTATPLKEYAYKTLGAIEKEEASSNRTPPQDECYAGVGAKSFYVGFAPLGIRTVIGADNRHHAMNKATKLWSQGWTMVIPNPTAAEWPLAYEHVSVKEYGTLVKEYQQLRKGA